MSEIKVNSIKGVAASTAALTINNTDGTCTANLSNRQNRNLIINGAMREAQRGTSSTTVGYQTVDRITSYSSGLDESPTYSQADVSSGTTPYTLGFRKAFKVQNGNQTSGAGADDHMVFEHRVEDQDIATSGWNYLSSSSNISFSFWVKSSVAQNFYFMFQSDNGSAYRYVMETGSLSANTWTKITKTIPGNSNLVFNNDTGLGMYISWHLFDGTNRTGTRPLNAWAAADNSSRTPDQTSTWFTTNNATFELTGVQLEVGSVATDFEHRSFADELALCQRYYYQIVKGDNQAIGIANYWSSTEVRVFIPFPVTMRAAPTLSIVTNSNAYTWYRENGYDNTDGSDFAIADSHTQGCFIVDSGSSGTSAGNAAYFKSTNGNADMALTAEL